MMLDIIKSRIVFTRFYSTKKEINRLIIDFIII